MLFYLFCPITTFILGPVTLPFPIFNMMPAQESEGIPVLIRDSALFTVKSTIWKGFGSIFSYIRCPRTPIDPLSLIFFSLLSIFLEDSWTDITISAKLLEEDEKTKPGGLCFFVQIATIS